MAGAARPVSTRPHARAHTEASVLPCVSIFSLLIIAHGSGPQGHTHSPTTLHNYHSPPGSCRHSHLRLRLPGNGAEASLPQPARLDSKPSECRRGNWPWYIPDRCKWPGLASQTGISVSLPGRSNQIGCCLWPGALRTFRARQFPTHACTPRAHTHALLPTALLVMSEATLILLMPTWIC